MAGGKGKSIPVVFGPTKPIAPNRSRYPGAPLVTSKDSDFVAIEVPKKGAGRGDA
jgi:hypothetical protein